jgi:hypothetical protein
MTKLIPQLLRSYLSFRDESNESNYVMIRLHHNTVTNL